MLVHGLLLENARPVLARQGIAIRDYTERITRNGYRCRLILGPVAPFGDTPLLEDEWASKYLKQRSTGWRGHWPDTIWEPKARIANALCHHGWFDAIAAMFDAGATRIETMAGKWNDFATFYTFVTEELEETAENWVDSNAILYGEPARWPVDINNRLFASCFCHIYEQTAQHFGQSRAALKQKKGNRMIERPSW